MAEERKARRAVFVAARVASTLPFLSNRARDFLDYVALRESSSVAQVEGVLERGLDRASDGPVHVKIDSIVDLQSARELSLPLLALRRHYPEARLDEVRMDGSGRGRVPTGFDGGHVPASSFQWQDGRETLWFDSAAFTSANRQAMLMLHAQQRRSGFVVAGLGGMAGVAGHEFGHLMRWAAQRAAAGTELEHSLAGEVVASAPEPERSQILAVVEARYRNDAAAIAAQTPQPGQAAALNTLFWRYYGKTAENEASRAVSTAKLGPTAAGVDEQGADGFGARTLSTRSPNTTVDAVHGWIMRALRRAPDDRPVHLPALADRLHRDGGGNPWLLTAPPVPGPLPTRRRAGANIGHPPLHTPESQTPQHDADSPTAGTEPVHRNQAVTAHPPIDIAGRGFSPSAAAAHPSAIPHRTPQTAARGSEATSLAPTQVQLDKDLGKG